MRPLFLLLALLATCAYPAQANELGRLFYTPQQRMQMEMDHAISGNKDGAGSKANSIMVNGVIQRSDGKRLVWLNGTPQPDAVGSSQPPAAVSIAVPGKPQPVRAKVGQRIILDQPTPEEK